jgi:hypothetical protein
MFPSRTLLLGLIALFSLLMTSCFDSPVHEDLRLRFLTNGMAVATSTILIEDPEQSNPALEKRLAETRQAILEGSDPWSARFAAMKPGAERSSWEKRLGVLRSAARSAVLTEPRDLEELFRDTSLSVSYSVQPERGIAELSIVPGPSTRATRRQREETERTLDPWTGDLAGYLKAVQELYAYLDEHPDRARPCFAALFDKETGTGELTAEEERRLERLNDAMGKVLEVLAIPSNAAYSPDEVSRLVYDPFPARLSLKLPGEPLEVEGFRKSAEGALTVRGLGLWEALRSLQGKWVSPDPVLVYVEGSRQEDHEVDLEGFLRKPRQAAPAHLLPSAREIRSEIEGRLRPERLCRVSWRIDPADETKFGWDEGEIR